jgi:hypothetical protein
VWGKQIDVFIHVWGAGARPPFCAGPPRGFAAALLAKCHKLNPWHTPRHLTNQTTRKQSRHLRQALASPLVSSHAVICIANNLNRVSQSKAPLTFVTLHAFLLTTLFLGGVANTGQKRTLPQLQHPTSWVAVAVTHDVPAVLPKTWRRKTHTQLLQLSFGTCCAIHSTRCNAN